MEKGKPLRAKAPTDMAGFLKFLSAAVERYDGDGINDAPGSPVVTHWQIENEVDGHNFWGDTPENYARLLKASYQIIKKANPKARVIIAGASSIDGFYKFYIPVLKELQNIADKRDERYFDVFDIHWYGYVGEYRKIENHDLSSFMDSYNGTLSKYGYGNTPLWITETGTYGGKRVVGKRGESLPEQDEAVQAAELVKRYISFIGNGVKKVFWYQMTEAHNDVIGTTNDYFENVGLIRNIRNKGDSHKKLAYYSYKFLIDMLEGSDWKTVRRIDLGKDVHAYRFLKNGKAIQVLWYDQSP